MRECVKPSSGKLPGFHIHLSHQEMHVKRTCAVDGCELVHAAKGYCMAHYTRFRRTGDPGPSEIWDKSAKRSCSAVDCDRDATSLGLCNRHYLRVYRTGDIDRDNHRNNHSRWLDRNDLNYDAAHDRVKRYRGLASTHTCPCGMAAEDWAYLHFDPNPLVDDRGRPFSDDLNAYQAMCRSCHKTFDWQIKRERVLKAETEAEAS